MGSIGRRHLRLARELWPELNIVLVRSGRNESAEEEKLADTVFYSLKEAVEGGIQAAVMAIPAVYHLDQAKELMQAGVHVLIEKPLSNSMDHVNKLIEVQKELNVVGLVGYCLRYDPAAMKFSEMLSTKNTGQILHANVDCGSYLPDWRPDQDYRKSVSAKQDLGGGVLLELSHELDYIRWFFGDMISVRAQYNNSSTLDIDAEDSADMIFDSAQGFSVLVHLDFNSRSIRRSCSARCTESDFVWDAVKQEVIWQPAEGPEIIENFNHDRDEIYRKQLQHFFSCIEHGEQPVVSLEDGAEVLRMVEAVRESNATGERVLLT